MYEATKQFLSYKNEMKNSKQNQYYFGKLYTEQSNSVCFAGFSKKKIKIHIRGEICKDRTWLTLTSGSYSYKKSLPVNTSTGAKSCMFSDTLST